MSETENRQAIVQHDEPTSEDRLNREQYAEAFARLAETCQTPLVIGLYGTWGVGKTSLMMLIKSKLDANKARAVWFDPWQHQFDENPVVALAHTLFDTLDSEGKEEGKRLLGKIAVAFGASLLKLTTGLQVKDIYELDKIYEGERFQIRDNRVRLREHFKKLIAQAVGDGGEAKRLVFFIDDLDRCMPDEALKLLEALKLYLNLEGCVYFLGVDRRALERSIKHRYQDLELKEADYLDKIVQLPFNIPLIEPRCMESFVEPLLSEELEACQPMLVACLGDNPRQVKRFINTLTFNHQLAKISDIPKYNPPVLALLLLIQLIRPELYRRIARQPDLLAELKQRPEQRSEEAQGLFDELLATHERLRQALEQVDLPEVEILRRYIYMTRAAGVAEEIRPEIDLRDILEKHQRWLNSEGKEGERADLGGADLGGAILRLANLGRAILRGADLGGADLRLADLAGANLRRADLAGANLRRADLRGADLGGADLRGADLRGANLRVVDLTGALITEVQLAEAITDVTTILPDGSKVR